MDTHGRRHRPHGSHAHSHDGAGLSDLLAAGTSDGIRALKISAVGLAVTAAAEFAVVAVVHSAALLADGLHNLGDVFTTVALWVAFVATRRAANNRYTFGYQRFEDLAGLVVLVAIVASAALAAYESIAHLVRGIVPTRLGLGAMAGLVGFAGNEAVAQVKVRTGRRIDSPSLVAEGQHSRVDGLASLAVVIGLGGVAIGLGWADAVAGLLLSAVILSIAWSAGRPILARLADRVDLEIIERVAREAIAVDGVVGVHDIRARWAGRALYVQMHIVVAASLDLARAHTIGEHVRHRIVHCLPQVVQAEVHLDPEGDGHHDEAGHHFRP